MADDINELLERIESLERIVKALQGRPDELRQPFERVFLARAAGGDDAEDVPANGFVEQTVNHGAVEDYPSGRKSLEQDGPAALVDPGDAFAVMEIPDFDDDGRHVMRYVPIRSSSVVQVRITGDQPGGGKYNGKIYTGSITPTGGTEADDTAWLAADLAMPEEGLSLPQDEDCIVVNLAENNEGSHALTAILSTQKLDHWGLRVGALNDGRAIVAIFAYSIAACA